MNAFFRSAKPLSRIKMMERARVRWSLSLTVALSCAAGCAHPWYLVESRYVASFQGDRAPEVTETDSYRTRRTEGLKVAVQAPDSCANESAAAASGAATGKGTLIRTHCGVEMALLEQALAKAGYIVSSWNAVSSIVTYEQITPRAAAAQLGAQVLFQVNSLERSETDPARDLRWERRFFESNQKGERLGDAFVSEERAQTLERGMNHGERSLVPETIMSATVNASVVDVKTGETIWFYEWTQAEVIKQDNTVQQLFVCNRKRENLCFLRTPAGQARKHTSAERSGGVSAISTKSGDQDARVAIYHELVRTVVEDLVNRFKVGHA